MKKNWVDFKRVKESVTFEQVLAHYGIDLKPAKGDELLGLCPFHEDTKPSFRVNTKKRVFHCFGCDAKGNVLDFVVRKEGVTVKKAAQLVGEWFGIGQEANEAVKANLRPLESRLGASESPPEPVEPNKPLKFTLTVEHDHPYLHKRGIDSKLAQEYGVGFCDRGMMKGRIAIPIHDAEGQLVAYAGRWVSGELPEGEEKYKLPPGFRKSLVLYNLHRVKGQTSLVVVEGFFSAMRLHRLGVPAVALMGRSISDEQIKLLQESGVTAVTLMMDGDPPGRVGQAVLIAKLSRKFAVRAADLPDGTEPDTVDENVLREVLS